MIFHIFDLTMIHDFLVGYSTNLVGKWHVGFFDWDYVPTARGFDTFLGIYMGEGDFWNHTKMGYLDMRKNTKPTWEYTGQHSTDVFTQVRSIDPYH